MVTRYTDFFPAGRAREGLNALNILDDKTGFQGSYAVFGAKEIILYSWGGEFDYDRYGFPLKEITITKVTGNFKYSKNGEASGKWESLASSVINIGSYDFSDPSLEQRVKEQGGKSITVGQGTVLLERIKNSSCSFDIEI